MTVRPKASSVPKTQKSGRRMLLFGRVLEGMLLADLGQGKESAVTRHVQDVRLHIQRAQGTRCCKCAWRRVAGRSWRAADRERVNTSSYIGKHIAHSASGGIGVIDRARGCQVWLQLQSHVGISVSNVDDQPLLVRSVFSRSRDDGILRWIHGNRGCNWSRS